MIKIDKSLLISDIPKSLRPPFIEFFSPNNIGRAARTTAMRRHMLIKKGAYIDHDVYNSRYKLKDIKTALSNIYKNKCAFCEQKIEQFHVEHYRPKQIYPWLTYSWDNLLCACQYCNEFKGTNFRINGTQAVFSVTLRNLKSINILSAGYDLSEQPDLVNPEVTDPEGMISFREDGDIFSSNSRFHYTIETCKIGRTYLRDRRRKLLDDLRKDLQAAFVDNKMKIDQAIAIETIINKFKRDAEDDEKEFIAFRKYILVHWLRQEVKNIKK